MQDNQENPENRATLRLSIGIGNTPPVPGFPSPSSSFVPPPAMGPTKFTAVPNLKEKRKEAAKDPKEKKEAAKEKEKALEVESIVSPTTPTPDGVNLHRQKSFPNSNTVIELPKSLPTDGSSTASATVTKAFGAAASAGTPSSSNPPTPSSPAFFSPGRKSNRDSTMSSISTSSAASAASSLKSTRPAPPSPALSRRTSGVPSAATSPIAKRFSTGPGPQSVSSSMSTNPNRYSSPAFRRDSSTMSVPAPLPLPLTPIPSAGLSSAALSSSGSGLSSAGLSSAGLKTATTVSTAAPTTTSALSAALSAVSGAGSVAKGKAVSSPSGPRKPIKVFDYAYSPHSVYSAGMTKEDLYDADPRFLGLGIDGKGLHVPTPNRVKVVNKTLMTSTSASSSSHSQNQLNVAYAQWKTEYKQERKDRKDRAKARLRAEKEENARTKAREKERAKHERERQRARFSKDSVRSVGSTSSTHSTASATSSIASSVSSTSSRSEVSEDDRRGEEEFEDDIDDGYGFGAGRGWSGFKFGLARLSQSWNFHPNPTNPNANSNSTNAKNTTNANHRPSRSDLERNFVFDEPTESSPPNQSESLSQSQSHQSLSSSGDDSDNSTDTEEYHDDGPSLPHPHPVLEGLINLDSLEGLDSPSPLDYDRQYRQYGLNNIHNGYGIADGDIPNSAYPSSSPYPAGYSDDYYDADESMSAALLPGLYKAVYAFEPEGPSEMRLAEGQIVKVIGRGGGGGGWAVVVDDSEDSEDNSNGNTEGEGGDAPKTAAKYALVPESYLEVVQLDEGDESEEAGDKKE